MLIVSIVLFFVFIALVFAREGLKEAGAPAGLIATLPLVASVILGVCSTFTIINPGQRGIVVLFGKADPEALKSGFHFVNPFAKVVAMSEQVEKEQETHPAETSDTQSVQITILTNWRPQGDALSTLYSEYGDEYAKKIIPPAIREAVKAEVAKYKVTDLILNRPQIHKNVQATINTWLNRYHLEVLEVSIADIDFSQKYDDAIEAKQVQEQQALQKQYELQRTETEAKMAAAAAKGQAESQIERATGEAQSVKIAAQAEADALKIRAEAQAEYNKKVAESLNPLLIQSQYLKTWDGKLPTYMLGSGSQTMLMLPEGK